MWLPGAQLAAAAFDSYSLASEMGKHFQDRSRTTCLSCPTAPSACYGWGPALQIALELLLSPEIAAFHLWNLLEPLYEPSGWENHGKSMASHYVRGRRKVL